jgi:hypothetical protein
LYFFCKICTLLFSHLTTSVVDIDIHLMEADVKLRGPDVDLAAFKRLLDPKQKAAAQSDDTPAQAADARGRALEAAAEVLSRIDLTPAAFDAIVKKLVGKMHVAPGNPDYRTHRCSEFLPFRFASASALIWNHDSRAKNRDWSLAATALAIEAGYIPTYRDTLVQECRGARVLRKAIYDVFLSVAERTVLDAAPDDSVTYLSTWSFPDNLPLADVPLLSSPEPLASLRSRWELARGQFEDGIRDPAFALIRQLERNKYLQSTIQGSVEAVAHFHITALAEVFPSCFLLALLSPLSDRRQE